MTLLNRYRVLPYKQGSRSAKALADALGGKVLKLVNSKFVPKPGDVIINWGRSEDYHFGQAGFYNDPFDVKEASNKLIFFNKMKAVDSSIIPQFWTNKSEIPNDVYPIVCRTILSGHSGAGIVIANCPDDLVDAPLYVRYIKKKDEYRVHCGTIGEKNGYPYSEGSPFTSIIAVQRKAKRTGTENVNWQVRNHANGFVYVRNDVNPPACVLDVAKAAFSASGLDFGAVDVIYNAERNKAYVLEINTAPGLEGQTIQDYASFLKGD